MDIDEVAFSPDGRLLATSSPDNVVRIWNASTRRPVRQFVHRQSVWFLAFTTDATHLTTGGADKTAHVWNVQTGQEMSRIVHGEDVSDAQFSHDGRYLATSTFAKRGYVWWWQRDDLLAEAGRRLTRNLTVDEWDLYLPDEPYRVTFTQLPDPRRQPE